MSGELLFLFHCPGSSLYAIAHDRTGCLMRRYVPESTWLMSAEVCRSEIPREVLLSIDRFGYCLLDEYEIQSTRPRWLVHLRH